MPFTKGHAGYRKHYAPKVESVCTVCGKRELRRPCEVRAYCGAACYHASRKGVRPKEITRACQQCGRTMTDYVSQIGVYCSRDCANEAKRTPPEARFWKYVDKSSRPSMCWFWNGGIGTDGYGKFWVNGSTIHAQRFAYELTHGPIGDPSLHVCHRCDEPRCVRPDHLFLGTGKDNAADMVRKGRSAAGEKHHAVKLTAALVRTIRFGRSAGVSGATLARTFGMSTSQISAIGRGRSWKHVK